MSRYDGEMDGLDGWIATTGDPIAPSDVPGPGVSAPAPVAGSPRCRWIAVPWKLRCGPIWEPSGNQLYGSDI